MAGGENETIAVGPLRVGRIELHVLAVKYERDIGAAHGQAAMAALRFLHRVDSQQRNGFRNE